MPGAGDLSPQLKSMIRSLRAITGAPARYGLFQYSPIQSGNVICPDAFPAERDLRQPGLLVVLDAQLVRALREREVDTDGADAVVAPLVDQQLPVDPEPRAVVHGQEEAIRAGIEVQRARPARRKAIGRDGRRRRAEAPVEVDRLVVAHVNRHAGQVHVRPVLSAPVGDDGARRGRRGRPRNRRHVAGRGCVSAGPASSGRHARRRRRQRDYRDRRARRDGLGRNDDGRDFRHRRRGGRDQRGHRGCSSGARVQHAKLGRCPLPGAGVDDGHQGQRRQCPARVERIREPDDKVARGRSQWQKPGRGRGSGRSPGPRGAQKRYCRAPSRDLQR